jgi:hypothetical protein
MVMHILTMDRKEIFCGRKKYSKAKIALYVYPKHYDDVCKNCHKKYSDWFELISKNAKPLRLNLKRR